MSDSKRCPFCQETILAGAIKCKHCASMLTEGQGPPSSPGTTSEAQSIPAWAIGAARIPEGTEIREYRIQRLLGSGGMGEVYKAEHTYTGQQVAIKAVHPGLMADQNVRRRFLEEGRVMAGLKHPGIVTPHNFFEDIGRFFLVMEFIEGVTLEEHLGKGALSRTEAEKIAGAVLSALQYAHTRPDPVVHRDIKPANIMIEKGGRVVVTDFGIARALGREKLTRTGSAIGTYEYMSPEQVRGEEVTEASDLYSVGIMLYQMLTGGVPFPQETDGGFEVMQAHVHQPPPVLVAGGAHLDAGLSRVVTRALAKAPGERFPDAEAFRMAMETPLALDAPEVSTPRPRPPTPLPTSAALVDESEMDDGVVSEQKRRPRSRAMGVLVAAGILGLVILAAFATNLFLKGKKADVVRVAKGEAKKPAGAPPEEQYRSEKKSAPGAEEDNFQEALRHEEAEQASREAEAAEQEAEEAAREAEEAIRQADEADEAARLASAGLSPEQTVRHFVDALVNGKLTMLWDLFPQAYQEDLSEVVTIVCTEMDREVFEASVKFIDRVLVAAEKHRPKIVQQIAVLVGDAMTAGEVEAVLDSTLKVWTGVKLTGLDRYASFSTLDLDTFLDQNGDLLGAEIVHGLKKTGIQDVNEFFSLIGTIEADEVSNSGEQAVVELRFDGETEEGTLLKVDGKWLPDDVVGSWSQEMSAAKTETRAAMKELAGSRQEILMTLEQIEPVLAQFEADGNLMTVMGVMGGGM